MDKTMPQQKNFSARNQKRFLKNQLKNQSLTENSTQKTSTSSDIDCLAKTKQTEQKNFSARNQKRFLKNQIRNQSLIENSTQKTSNSSGVDCTNQTKAIETGIVLLIDQVAAVTFERETQVSDFGIYERVFIKSLNLSLNFISCLLQW